MKQDDIKAIEMKDLSIFTDDELRAELRRRRAIKLRENRPKIEYLIFTGVVENIINIRHKYIDGSVQYEPFYKWVFKVKNLELVEGECSFKIPTWKTDFKCHQKIAKKDAPKVGDKVKLKVRKTKHFMLHQFNTTKIVEVIHEKD